MAEQGGAQAMLMLQHEGGGERWEVHSKHEAHRPAMTVKVCEDFLVVDGGGKEGTGTNQSGDEFEDFEVRLRSLSFSSSA